MPWGHISLTVSWIWSFPWGLLFLWDSAGWKDCQDPSMFSHKFYSKVELFVLWCISLFSHYVTGNYKPCSTFGTLPRNLPSHITSFIGYVSIFHLTTDNRFQCFYTFHHYTGKFPFLYFLIIVSQLSFKPSLTASRLLLRISSKPFQLLPTTLSQSQYQATPH